MSHVLERNGVVSGVGVAVLLALVHLSNDALGAVLGALLPSIEAWLEVDEATLAAFVGIFLISSSLLQPLLGATAEWLGPRSVVAGGMALTAVTVSLVGVVPSVWLLVLVLIIGGLGSAAIHPVGMAIAGSPAGRRPGLAIGFFTAGGMLGAAVGPLLVLGLIERFGGEATLLLLAPGAAMAVLAFALLPEWQRHARPRWRLSGGMRFLRGDLALLTASSSLVALAFVTFTSALPLWLVRTRGLETDDALIGLTLGTFALAAGVGSILGGVASARISGTRIVALTLGTAPALLVATLFTTPGGAAFYGAVAAAGVLLSASQPLYVLTAQQLAPHARAAASGVVAGATAGLAGALYIAVGPLQASIGLERTMIGSFMLPAAAALLAIPVLRRRR